MLDHPFRFEIGPYWLTLPRSAVVAATVNGPTSGAYQMAFTNWIARLGRFQFLLHLDALHDPTYLKTFIDQQTKGNAAPAPITVNGVAGFSYGDYGPDRTWIDW